MKCTLQFLTIAACLASAVLNAAKASADESARAQYRWAKSPYGAMLERILDLQLVEAVPSVQLSIRLLVPRGSRLLELPGFADKLMPFDAKLLGYPWRHADPRVDRLQQDVQRAVSGADPKSERREVFAGIWRMAHEAAALPLRPLGAILDKPIPRLSEPWYCCAEPTDQQLQAV